MAMNKFVSYVFLMCFSVTLAFHLNQGSESDLSSSNHRANESGDTQAEAHMEPLSFSIGYSNFVSMNIGWPSTNKNNDYGYNTYLLDCTTRASSCEEFVKKYPTFTIETTGKIVSDDIFGDAGKDKFGSLTYPTKDFIIEKPVNNYPYIIKVCQSAFGYDISVKLGVALVKNDNLLNLNPFIDGYMKTDGLKEISLQFGFRVSKITFNPGSDTLKDEVNSSDEN